MHLPAARCGGDLHHVKADAGIGIGAGLQVLRGGGKQPLLLLGGHRLGGGCQHTPCAGLDLGKDKGIVLVQNEVQLPQPGKGQP